MGATKELKIGTRVFLPNAHGEGSHGTVTNIEDGGFVQIQPDNGDMIAANRANMVYGVPGWTLQPETRTTLTDGRQVYPEHRNKITDGPRKGQQQDYVVLSEEERAKGFVRPVRRSYIHQRCGSMTTMNLSLAETYARDPKFYSGTFCCACGNHFPVGSDGEFVWDGTNEKVGT